MSGQIAETTTANQELRVPSHGRGRLAPLWEKGKSPNPGGLGPASMYHQARKICALHTEEAIARQIQLMRESTDDRVVTIVTQAIIDRGAGKIRDHSNEQEQSRLDLSALSMEQRAALAELLLKAMGRDVK